MARSSVPHPDIEELGRRLVDRVDAVLRAVDRVVDGSRGSPTTLHLLHRDLRRLRVGIAVWRRAGPRRRAAPLREFDRRLKRLARLVGGVRDRDVALGLLRSAAPTLSADERREFAALRRHLGTEARIGRTLLRAALRRERDLGLFEGIREAFASVPAHRRSGDALRYLAQLRAEGEAALRAAGRKARRRPTSRRLHRLRIEVRGWRQLGALAAAIAPAVGADDPRLRTLQAELGRLHDLDVTGLLAADEAPAPVVRVLHRAQRRARRRLVRTLRADLAAPFGEGAAAAA
jgi:CHAD domain-containing protein